MGKPRARPNLPPKFKPAGFDPAAAKADERAWRLRAAIERQQQLEANGDYYPQSDHTAEVNSIAKEVYRDLPR